MIYFNKKLYAFIIPLMVTYTDLVRALPADINDFSDNNYPVLMDELDGSRGQGGVIDITSIVNSNIDANLSNNTAFNNINGDNVIGNGAFTEASGVFSIIQNSGNNVIIQDSTIVNVTITP